MSETELKIAREKLMDARRSGNPAIQELAAVCEFLLTELRELEQWKSENQKNWQGI